MAKPSIKIDQTGKSAGTTGQSRDELDLGKEITATDTANSSGSWSWTVVLPPGSGASPTGLGTDTVKVTPDVPGTYLFFVVHDGTEKSYDEHDFGSEVLKISTQGGAGIKDPNGDRRPGTGETFQFGTDGYAPALTDIIKRRNIVKKDGNSVTGGPFTTFDFKSAGGAQLIVEDEGSGEASVTLSGGPALDFEDQGISVPNGPHTKVNFVGAPVQATDVGSGVLQVTVSGGGLGDDEVPAKYFDGYDAAGGTTIDGTWNDIVLDTDRVINTSTYSHTPPSAEVTVDDAGKYIVTAEVTTEITSGSSRSQIRMRVAKNGVEIPGSIASMYARTSGQSEATGSVTMVLDLEAGDTIKMQAQRISGSSSIATLANGSRLTLTSLAFTVSTGIDGVDVKDDGNNVDATPHTGFNFAGDGVSVSNAGNGFANVNIPGAVAGSFEFLDKIDVSNDTDKVTFSGIDGNTDEIYTLYYNIDNTYSGTAVYRLVPNETVTDQYSIKSVNDVSSSESDLTFAELDRPQMSGYLTFYAKSGKERSYNATSASVSGGVNPELHHYAGSWDDTNTNITTLGIESTTGTHIGPNSSFALYRLDNTKAGTTLSGVFVEDDGVAIPDGPFVTLNFNGDPVTVSGSGSSRVDISISGTGGGGGSETGGDSVKVSSNDLEADFLANKLVAGSGISLAELNDGDFETLEINTTINSSSYERDASFDVPTGDSLQEADLGRISFSGSVISLTAGIDDPRTAGSIVVTAKINNNPTISGVIDSDNTEFVVSTADEGTHVVSPEDSLTLEVDGQGYDNSGSVTTSMVANVTLTNSSNLNGDPAVATLNSTQVFTAGQSILQNTLTPATNVELDGADTNNFEIELDQDITLDNPINVNPGQVINVAIRQNATGGHAVSYGDAYRFVGGTPTITSAANAEDLISCYVRAVASGIATRMLCSVAPDHTV